MKKKIISAVVLFAVPLIGGAQLVAPAPDGARARGELMLTLNDALGAADASRQSKDLWLRARSLFAEGQYALARSEFMKLCSRDVASPLYVAAAAGAADCLFAAGDYKAALSEYIELDRSALSSAESAAVAYRCGVCAFECGDNVLAEKLLSEASSEPSVRSDACFYLGVKAFDAGQYDKAAAEFANVNTSRAPGVRVPYYMAQIDFARGQWQKALSAARQILKQGSAADRPEMTRVAGEALCRTGKQSEGVAELRKYLKMCNNPVPSAQYIVSVADYENGDIDAALKNLNPVVEKADGALRQSAYLYIGQALMQQGDYSAALLALDKAASDDSDPAVREAAMYNYAVASMAGASLPFKSSVDMLEDFLKQYPDGPYTSRVAACLAEGYLADKNYAAALERIGRISSPGVPELAIKQRALYALAWQAMNQGDMESADKYISGATGIKGNSVELAAEISLLRGQILAARGRNPEAADCFRSYLDRARNGQNRTVAQYGLAYALYSCGRAAESEKIFRSLAAGELSEEMRADVLKRLGDLRYASDDFAAAADYYGDAQETNAANGDGALLDKARMLGYMRDYEGKLQALAQFRRSYPKSKLLPDALLETSQAQISLGRNSDAVETYRSLIRDYPTTSAGRRAYIQMGMTLIDMKRRAEAFEAYRTLISKYPTSEEAAQASKLLKNLYMEDGNGDEYLAFVQSVGNAPAVDSAEAEEISYTTALNRFRRNGDSSAIEKFISDYPSSPHNPDLLAAMLESAAGKGNTAGSETVARRIVEQYPDSRAAEPAMVVLAEVCYKKDSLPEAIKLWEEIERRTADSDRLAEARAGIMRARRDMGENEAAIAKADEIIASHASPALVSEARYVKACALDADGKTDAALEIWQAMASNTSDLNGSKSAYRAAEALFATGKLAKAREAAQKFVESGSPHAYWVARGFILLSDIYKADGKEFEAREYLEALRDNYPGKETDIETMIEERLKTMSKNAEK